MTLEVIEDHKRSFVWFKAIICLGSLPACWREHSKLLLGAKENLADLTFTKAKHWNIDQVSSFSLVLCLFHFIPFQNKSKTSFYYVYDWMYVKASFL